jgi:hypothetical protein
MSEQHTSDTEKSTFRVEAGVVRTGVVVVEAQGEEHARQLAREKLENETGGHSLSRSFTNNVRSVAPHSDQNGE